MKLVGGNFKRDLRRYYVYKQEENGCYTEKR